MANPQSFLNNPNKSNSLKITRKVNKTRRKRSNKSVSTGEDEYLGEIDRFYDYVKTNKNLVNLKDFINHQEKVFEKDKSLKNLRENMSSGAFKEGAVELHKKWLEDNKDKVEKFFQQKAQKVEGKTKQYKGFEYKEFNVIYAKGLRYIDKNTGRFIKRPNPKDFFKK